MTTAPACLVYLVLAWSCAEAVFLDVFCALDQLDLETRFKRCSLMRERCVFAIGGQGVYRSRALRVNTWSTWSIGLSLIKRAIFETDLDQPRPENGHLDQLCPPGAVV